MTNWWTVSGTGTLGLTIGWLVWTFVVRSTTLPVKAISTLVAIVAGSASLLVWSLPQPTPFLKKLIPTSSEFSAQFLYWAC